jgi:hypothetical protein
MSTKLGKLLATLSLSLALGAVTVGGCSSSTTNPPAKDGAAGSAGGKAGSDGGAAGADGGGAGADGGGAGADGGGAGADAGGDTAATDGGGADKSGDAASDTTVDLGTDLGLPEVGSDLLGN